MVQFKAGKQFKRCLRIRNVGVCSVYVKWGPISTCSVPSGSAVSDLLPEEIRSWQLCRRLAGCVCSDGKRLSFLIKLIVRAGSGWPWTLNYAIGLDCQGTFTSHLYLTVCTYVQKMHSQHPGHHQEFLCLIWQVDSIKGYIWILSRGRACCCNTYVNIFWRLMEDLRHPPGSTLNNFLSHYHVWYVYMFFYIL